MKVGIISDTHGAVLEKVEKFLEECDEIWHAGDVGNIRTLEKLRKIKPLRAVYGNVDDSMLRLELSEFLYFQCEDLKVMMTHIGGYPKHYPRHIRNLIQEYRPDIFVCGHSHILRVMRDEELQTLCINPGAAGAYGFHTVITALRLDIRGKEMSNLQVLEISRG